MKRTFTALLTLCIFTQIFAQDTTLTPVAARHHGHLHIDSVTAPVAKRYLIYNFTSPMLNSPLQYRMRDSALNRIEVEGNFFANSRGTPAALAYDLLFNLPLPQRIIDRADKHIGNSVKFEESLNSGISYERYLKRADMTLVVGYNYRQMLNVFGPKQAFETIFYGNARFEGDTANLSNIKFDFYSYNQLSVGLIKHIDYGSYQMDFGISGSFLQVINNIDIQTQNTSIYTAPYGEYVDINYNLTYNAASPTPAFRAPNGIGASGDFNLAFSNKDKWRLAFDIKDLGIMTFRKHELNYSGVNNIDFQGFVIPNLLNFSSQTFDTLNLDSALLSKLPSKSNNTYTLFLPFTADVIFSKPVLNDRLILTAGLQYRHIPGYNVYGYVKANYFLSPDMVVSASAGAGGYSLFDLGFEFAKSWKYFDVAVGTPNLIGLIAPTAYSGGGVYLRMGTTF